MGYFNDSENDKYIGSRGVSRSSSELGRQFENPLQGLEGTGVLNSVMSKVYGWMAFALFLSGLAAYFVGHNEAAQAMLFSGFAPILVLSLVELGLVWYLSSRLFDLSVNTATGLFVAYSVISGLTLGSIFLVYSGESIVLTFGVCALTFLGMSIYGMTTKRDLTSIGSYLFYALIGLIVAGLVNIFLKSSMLNLIISLVGVAVFIGLTAYDTQKIKQMAAQFEMNDSDTVTKVAVMGALSLYLDFVNLFLYLLRFFGRSNKD